MTPFRIIAQTIIIIAVFSLAWWLRGCGEPEEIQRTRTVYVDRELVRTDTVTVERPVTRYIFQRTTDTVVVRIPVPVGFTPYGVISPAPIKISGRSVTLSYWQPDSLRWMQDVYRVGPANWHAGLSLEADRDLLSSAYAARLRATLRYRRAFAYVSGGVEEIGAPGGAQAAVRVGVGIGLIRWGR